MDTIIAFCDGPLGYYAEHVRTAQGTELFRSTYGPTNPYTRETPASNYGSFEDYLEYDGCSHYPIRYK